MSDGLGTTVRGEESLIDQLQRLDPYEFEKLIAAIWENNGYSTKVHDQSHDKGIDVTATRKKPVSEKILIQAKRFKSENKVGSNEVRRYATLYQQDEDADTVVLATTSTFTQQAQTLAADLNVKTIDKHGLLERLSDEPEVVKKYISPFSPEEEEVAEVVRLQNNVVLNLNDVTSAWSETFTQMARESKLWTIGRDLFGLSLYPPRKQGLEDYLELRELIDSRINGIELVLSMAESLDHNSIDTEEVVITERDLESRKELLLELQGLLEGLLEAGDRVVSEVFIDCDNPFEGDLSGVQSLPLKSNLESPPEDAIEAVDDIFERIAEWTDDFSSTYNMQDNAGVKESLRWEFSRDG
jgi:hypothetical protein